MQKASALAQTALVGIGIALGVLILLAAVGFIAVTAFIEIYADLYPALGNAIHPDEHTPNR